MKYLIVTMFFLSSLFIMIPHSYGASLTGSAAAAAAKTSAASAAATTSATTTSSSVATAVDVDDATIANLKERTLKYWQAKEEYEKEGENLKKMNADLSKDFNNMLNASSFHLARLSSRSIHNKNPVLDKNAIAIAELQRAKLGNLHLLFCVGPK